MGYPIWRYELPIIVQGLVKDHDWASKTIARCLKHAAMATVESVIQ